MSWRMDLHARVGALRTAAACVLLCALPAVAALDLAAAQRKSASLSQSQMDRAWDFFEGGVRAAKAGGARDALNLLRKGLAIHPMEYPPHVLAAQLAEAGGEDAMALTHWQATALLAPVGSTEHRNALEAVARLEPRLRLGVAPVQCAVLGMQVLALPAQCDTPPVPAPSDAERALRHERDQAWADRELIRRDRVAQERRECLTPARRNTCDCAWVFRDQKRSGDRPAQPCVGALTSPVVIEPPPDGKVWAPR